MPTERPWWSVLVPSRALPAAVAAVVWLGAMSIVMYQERLHDGVINVDDYLYSRQTIAYWGAIRSLHGLRGAWKQFAINSPLLSTLAAPLVAFSQNPARLVLVNLPLVLLLLLGTAALLRSLGLAGPIRWLLAGVIAAAPPVLTYTAMFNFGVVASVCLIFCCLAYARSKRLRRRRVCLLLGLALGFLSLSRVVAVVYLAALIVPFVADAAIDRFNRRARIVNGLLALMVAAIVAAPWWLTAGPQAVHYLVDAGYSSNSVFVGHAGLFQRQLDRLSHTADETGWLLALAVLVLFVSGAALAVWRLRRSHSDEAARHVVVMAVVVVLGMLFLGTSTNSGTAFALPFFVLGSAVGVAGWGSGLQHRAVAVRLAAATVVVLLIGFTTVQVVIRQSPPTWGRHQVWLSGTPARAQFEQALGCTSSCSLPNASDVNARIVTLIGSAPTLILRGDAVVNPESLRYRGLVTGVAVDLTAQAAPGTLVPASLSGVDFAIAGSTPAPYLASDLGSADSVLRVRGWCDALKFRLSTSNLVEIWASPTHKSLCPLRN